MSTNNHAHSPIVDPEGFLLDFSVWNRNWVIKTALELGYADLSADQWKIIYALRDYYNQHKNIPNQHQVCKISGLEHFCLDKHFRNDGKQAWKLAGLPNPGEEIKAYL
jgi:tRNA 2-thiouridine synthesizing protein E